MSQSKKLVEIQSLRCFAALSVVLYHIYYVFKIYNNFNIDLFEYGFLGVQIFFMISGFIMSLPSVTSLDAKKFIKKRFYRIFPSYIIVTLAITPYYIFAQVSDLPESLFYSLVLFPHFSSISNSFHPILGVGWTLQFEMVFYYVVMLLLTMSLNNKVLIATIFLLGVSFSVKYLSNNQVLQYIFDPSIFIFFFLGGALYKLYTSIAAKAALYSVLIASVAGLFICIRFGFNQNDFIVRMMVALLIFTLPFSFSSKSLLSNPYIVFVASISYELYLVHHPIISLLGKFNNNHLSFEFFLIISIILSVISAWVLNMVVTNVFKH